VLVQGLAQEAASSVSWPSSSSSAAAAAAAAVASEMLSRESTPPT
jgi:hypothetical protein